MSEWATRTHTVHKKDDTMGRWICDFRDLNRATVKTPIVLGDSHDMVRTLAKKKYKTCFDAWAGFNQVSATERASRAMQVTTSVGLRQWVVMPFGVTNGPSCFQGIMVDHFAPLEDDLKKYNATIAWFFDDGTLGSGDYTCPDHEDDSKNGFDEHMKALDLVFKRAAKIDLRFKLSKCHFLQFSVPILGEVAGLGTVTPDPKKTDAIRSWPRPSKIEDVERFLCTISFFRAHVSPRFSEISLPLRECMSELHERRAAGKYRKVIRGKDPNVTNRHGDASDDNWPSFWNQACEDSFNELRILAGNAVDLSVVDFDGAMNGTNPFLLYPDACKYGVGSGLFQATPVSPELKESHYAALGLPAWSTKAAIDARYQELKRLYRDHAKNVDKLKSIEDAHEVLGPVENRKAYDEQIGLEKVHKSRIDLQPLGFFSKSLSGAQRNWATWDRELFAVVASLEHFSSMVSGSTVVIATDHLNNTVLNVDLKQPEKILRMLLKIHTKVNPIWQFQPGRGQLGDGFSRNPVDRDQVRDADAECARLPKTLVEAFDMVSKASASGNLDFDDCEELTQQFRILIDAYDDRMASVCRFHETDLLFHGVKPRDFAAAVERRSVRYRSSPHVGCVACNDIPLAGSISMRANRPRKDSKAWHPTFTVPCLFLPNSHLKEELILNDLGNIKITGPEMELTCSHPFGEGSLNYTCLDYSGSGRWLEAYSTPPWNKEVTKRARLTLIDGVLKILRLANQVKGVVAFGEACYLALGACDPTVREACFKERSVNVDEAFELEYNATTFLKHVVLIAPSTFPKDSYLPFLRHYFPELSHVDIGDHQVSIVVPVDDSYTHSGRDFARLVQNAVSLELPMPKPSYRTLPSELFLETLVPVVPTPKVVSSPEGLPTLCAECMGGSAVLSQQLVRFGFMTRCFEKYPDGPAGAPLAEGDLGRVENQRDLGTLVINRKVYHVHLSPDCGSFSISMNANPNLCTRTKDKPQGDGTLPKEVQGNITFAEALWILWLCVRYGVSVSLEHPTQSKAFYFQLLAFLLDNGYLFKVVYDSCAWYKRPADWNPAKGDLRVQGPSTLYTNNDHLVVLKKMCVDSGTHTHEPAQGRLSSGAPRTSHKAQYSQPFCVAFAHALRSSWLLGFRPKPITSLPKLLLPDLIKSINMTFRDVANLGRTEELPPLTSQSVRVHTVVQRPSYSGGGASSASGNVPPADVPSVPAPDPAPVDPAPAPDASVRTEDYWSITPDSFIRYHIVPRRELYAPTFGEPDGPNDASAIQPTRKTTLHFTSDGTSQVYPDVWDDPRPHKKRWRSRWTGQTVFLRAETPAPEGALVHPGSGAPVTPATPAAVGLALGSLRDELKIAQGKDPKLIQIIACLDKKPPQTYIADCLGPSAELKKCRARVVHFRLAEDRRLHGKHEDGSVYLPVVPDGPYVGAGRAKNAPCNMTWKHLLLGAVHNTRAAAHLSAQDMFNELKDLVYWFPPESLKPCCDQWVERCKHCCAVHQKPKYTPHCKSVLSFRPFHRVQIDLMEIKPTGANGETHILTALCVGTRYPFFRVTKGRDQVDIALLLLDIFLDAGVVPHIVHSDNEFISLALEELTALMGSCQLFSTALRPQSLGADERTHRDIRRGLAILIDAFARANPRSWPLFTRYLESKARHRKMASLNITPYMAWHGFSGVSELASALVSFEEIPEGLIHSEWLSGIQEEAKKISAALENHWKDDAAARARKMAESATPPPFCIGDLVLCAKPFYERGVGMILPQADGPFIITKILGDHTCTLKDAVSGEIFQKGSRVSLARLIAFKYPVDSLEEEVADMKAGVAVADLRPQDLVAVDVLGHTWVASVIRTFVAQGQAQVNLFSVPTDQRYGPWNRRKWALMSEHGMPVIEIVTESELLCKVELQDDALTDASLEALAAAGVPVGGQIHRNKTLPTRLARITFL